MSRADLEENVFLDALVWCTEVKGKKTAKLSILGLIQYVTTVI